MRKKVMFRGGGHRNGNLVATLLSAVLCTSALAADVPKSNLKFAFGQHSPPGFVQVLSSTMYDSKRGYGLMSASALESNNDALCSKDKPFLFEVDVPEGNYDVKLTLGGGDEDSLTTVKAEARRLIFKEIDTPRRKLTTRTFTINVRYKELSDGRAVRIKKDEENDFDWDHRLTFEFNNSHPCISSFEIKKNVNAVTVYIAGDSTVTDQRKEPWAAWGQMLPSFFRKGAAIANHAESGESLKSFIGENRLAKLLEALKAGDYLFIQFAHNDQKPGPSHVDALTTYKEYLTRYIDQARKRKAIPVLVTSMYRRRFNSQGQIVNTLEDYPDAMRQLAKEQKVALIDLNAMSKKLFEALGPEGTLKAFVHYPAHTFPDQDEELKDDTHFNSYGAYELARCVVEGIKASKLRLTKYLVQDIGDFDPAKPDPVSSWKLPLSPFITDQKPGGN